MAIVFPESLSCLEMGMLPTGGLEVASSSSSSCSSWIGPFETSSFLWKTATTYGSLLRRKPRASTILTVSFPFGGLTGAPLASGESPFGVCSLPAFTRLWLSLFERAGTAVLLESARVGVGGCDFLLPVSSLSEACDNDSEGAIEVVRNWTGVLDLCVFFEVSGSLGFEKCLACTFDGVTMLDSVFHNDAALPALEGRESEIFLGFAEGVLGDAQ